MTVDLIDLCSKWRPWTWGECVTNFLRDAINTAFGGFFKLIFEGIGAIIAGAVGLVIKAVGALWVYVPTVHPSNGSQPIEEVSFMRTQIWFFVIAATTVSVIIAGVRMAWQQRGEPLRDLLKSLLTLVIASFTAVAAIGLLTRAGDELARSFIDEAVDRSGMSFAENLVAMIANPLGAQALPIIVLFGFAAVFTSFLQIIFMIVRNGMLIILTVVLPLAAAATNTEMGQQWFRRICGWTIAFIAYKPLAALIYAAAITLAGSQGDLIKISTGLMMMALSVITLPALLRLVSPSKG
jgi:hypothetical protein